MLRGIFVGVLIGLSGAWAEAEAATPAPYSTYYISRMCQDKSTCGAPPQTSPRFTTIVAACQWADSLSSYTYNYIWGSCCPAYCIANDSKLTSFADVNKGNQCPAGTTLSGGQCYCDNGGDWNATTQSCDCPAGKVPDGQGGCVDPPPECPDRGWSAGTFDTGLAAGSYAPSSLRCFAGCVWQCNGGVVLSGSPQNSYAASCKSVPDSACDGSEEGEPSGEEHPGEEVPEEPGPADEPFEGPCPPGMVPEYNPVTGTLGCGAPVQACPGGTSRNPVTGHCTCREDGTGAAGCAGNTGQREETQTTVTNPDGSTTTTREVWKDGVFKGTETIHKDANGNITGRAATGQLGSEEEGGSSAKAGDCSAGFQCKGDAVQCAQLRVAWEQKCLMEYHEGEANEAEDLREKETVDVGGFDSYGDLFGSGVCPSGVSVSLPGAGNVTADVGAFCELAELMRPFVILSALVFGMVYAFRGGGF